MSEENTIEINEEKEKEIVQAIMNNASDYTIEELTSYLINSLQQAVNSGKKISFICIINSILRIHLDILVKNLRKESVVLTLREQLNNVITHLKNQGFPDLTKEEAEALIATSQAHEQQE